MKGATWSWKLVSWVEGSELMIGVPCGQQGEQLQVTVLKQESLEDWDNVMLTKAWVKRQPQECGISPNTVWRHYKMRGQSRQEIVGLLECQVRPVECECWEVVGTKEPQELYRITTLHEDIKDGMLYDEADHDEGYTDMWGSSRGIGGQLGCTGEWTSEVMKELLSSDDERLLGTGGTSRGATR